LGIGQRDSPGWGWSKAQEGKSGGRTEKGFGRNSQAYKKSTGLGRGESVEKIADTRKSWRKITGSTSRIPRKKILGRIEARKRKVP